MFTRNKLTWWQELLLLAALLVFSGGIEALGQLIFYGRVAW